MKKTLFKINANHAVDLITNSSSELFVLKGSTKGMVIDMIESAHPNYRSEYHEPRLMSELDAGELNTYIDRHFDRWSNTAQKKLNGVIPGFTFDEMYYNWNEKHGYKNDGREPSYYVSDEFVEKNQAAIAKALDPNDEMYFMFSLDENPEWEFQEKLMEFGTRYHLG